MRFLFAILFSIPFLFGPPSNLEKANEAFTQKKYAEAIGFIDLAIAEYPLKTEPLRFNTGQCFFLMDSTAKAQTAWFKSIHKDHTEVSSKAHNNIGVLQGESGKPEEIKLAFESWKNALRLDPDNETSRYNYELLKKKLQQQQEQNQEQQQQNEEQQQDKQDEKQDQDQEQQQDKQDENSDEQKESEQQNQSTTPQQNQKPNAKEGQGDEVEYKPISMEQAKMLLEGMKENEKKFLQELRKSPRKKSEKGQPEW